MKKSEKVKKLAEINKNIDKIKNIVNRISANYGFVRTVSFEKYTDEELDCDVRFDSVLDCGNFNLSIVCFSESLIPGVSVDAEIKFNNSNYTYTFYDIFNLFDIDDFELYYYDDLETPHEFNDAVKNIMDAADKYYKYIDKAQTAEYLPLLAQNYETDMTAVYDDDSWKGEEKDLFLRELNHPMYSCADGEITSKLHKKLKKKNDKDELDTLYEKRLLKYLESGNTVKRKGISEKTSFEKLYSRKSRQILLIVFIASMAVALALICVVNMIVFKNAEFFAVKSFFLNTIKAFPFNILLDSAFYAFFVTVAVWFVFGLNLILKHMPDNMKNRAENKYRKEAGINKGRIKYPELHRLILSVLSIAFVIAAFIVSFDNIGFYDDRVKFSSHDEFFEMIDVQCDELNIYSVQYDYIGRHNRYQPVENAYIITDSNGNYYNFGEISPNGKTQVKLNEISEKYNKEFIEVESIDYIPSINE